MNADDIERLAAVVERAVERNVTPGAKKSSEDQIADAIFTGVTGYIERKLAPLIDRLSRLEQGGAMTFEGSHDPGRAYSRGAVVQRGGKLFVSMIDRPRDTPGASSEWRSLT
jgi:hypothetical protein